MIVETHESNLMHQVLWKLWFQLIVLDTNTKKKKWTIMDQIVQELPYENINMNNEQWTIKCYTNGTKDKGIQIQDFSKWCSTQTILLRKT